MCRQIPEGGKSGLECGLLVRLDGRRGELSHNVGVSQGDARVAVCVPGKVPQDRCRHLVQMFDNETTTAVTMGNNDFLLLRT